MAIENEKRYLVTRIMTSLDGLKSMSIKQGYLENENEWKKRVRIIDGKMAVITLKKGRGQIREEKETEISLKEGLLLMSEAKQSISKMRYYKDGWEIDLFSGNLDGLIFAERELREGEAEFPSLPEWLEGVEVTEIVTSRKIAKISKKLEEAGCQYFGQLIKNIILRFTKDLWEPGFLGLEEGIVEHVKDSFERMRSFGK